MIIIKFFFVMPKPEKKTTNESNRSERAERRRKTYWVYLWVRYKIADSRTMSACFDSIVVRLSVFTTPDTLNGFAAEYRISQCAENLAAKNGWDWSTNSVKCHIIYATYFSLSLSILTSHTLISRLICLMPMFISFRLFLVVFFFSPKY